MTDIWFFFRAVNQLVQVAWTACSFVINRPVLSITLSASRPNHSSLCKNFSMRSVLCSSFAISLWRRFQIYVKNWPHLLPTRWHRTIIIRQIFLYQYGRASGRQGFGYGRKSGVKMIQEAAKKSVISPFRIPVSVLKPQVKKLIAHRLLRRRILPQLQVKLYCFNN